MDGRMHTHTYKAKALNPTNFFKVEGIIMCLQMLIQVVCVNVTIHVQNFNFLLFYRQTFRSAEVWLPIKIFLVSHFFVSYVVLTNFNLKFVRTSQHWCIFFIKQKTAENIWKPMNVCVILCTMYIVDQSECVYLLQCICIIFLQEDALEGVVCTHVLCGPAGGGNVILLQILPVCKYELNCTFEPRHDKTNKMSVCPESSLGALSLCLFCHVVVQIRM